MFGESMNFLQAIGTLMLGLLWDSWIASIGIKSWQGIFKNIGGASKQADSMHRRCFIGSSAITSGG